MKIALESFVLFVMLSQILRVLKTLRV